MNDCQSKVAFCCVENPLNSRVWSRTPLNVAEVFKGRDRLGPAIWGIPQNSIRIKLSKLAAGVQYRNLRLFRHLIHAETVRNAHAEHIQRQILALGARHVMHFGANHYLPLALPSDCIHQYLLLDATWCHWPQPPRISRRYVSDVDRGMHKAYRQMTHLFTTSEFCKNSLVEDYGISERRISVVGTGRGTIQPYGGEKDFTASTVLFVAKERFKDKGGEILLSAFQLARRHNPALQLWIVARENVSELEKMKIPNVKVFGFLPQEELQDLFNRACLYAMPALWEPWGLVYLEALACQTPILGLNRNSVPEITGHGRYGFCVEEPTAEAVSEAILKAFQDPQKLQQMGKEGQKYVLARFNWEQVADRILERIDQVAAAKAF